MAIANLERKLTERDSSPQFPRTHSQQSVKKVALMEKRLKEAGISTEQLGLHELVKEIQVWIHSLNGGWSSNPNVRDLSQNRQLPPTPAEGGRNESQSESKLHTWLLKGLALRGKAHWKNCSDSYERYKPLALDVVS